MRVVTLLLAFALSTPASAQTFDLNCRGVRKTTTLYTGDTQEPYTSHFRIDLTSGQWCEAECKAIFPIADVQPASIVLQNKDVDSITEKSLLVNRINRETGEHVITSTYQLRRDRSSMMLMTYKGACEKQAFSGFPKLQTKF